MAREVTIIQGDNRRVLRALKSQGIFFDSVVTDPPYGLTSIINRFGGKGAAAAKHGKDGSFSRLSGGFMGKLWDGTQIERDPEFWRIVLEVLKPGGYCFAFSGSRTGHWQAVAMEQAGLIMHPMHIWAYGTGFPKGNNARAAGEEWEGWAYSTQAQKPALEPIYLAQRPFSEKTGIANIQKHGVGAVNIDGCRVPGKRPKTVRGASSKASSMSGPLGAQGVIEDDGKGRYPSNLLLDDSSSVAAAMPGGNEKLFHQLGYTEEDYQHAIDAGLIADIDAHPVHYESKASSKDRRGSDHPTVKPVALMQYLVRHVTPRGGHVLDMFAGSGTTAVAALREGMDCTLIEKDPEYSAFLTQRFGKTVTQIARQRIRARP